MATRTDPAGTEVLTTLRRLDEAVNLLRERESEPAPDLDDPRTLDELAGKLYRYVRSRLRAELIVDRERAGLLADRR